MNDPKRKRRKIGENFVSKVGRLADMYLQRAELKAFVAHEWVTEAGVRWAVIFFNDRPYLACEEDV